MASDALAEDEGFEPSKGCPLHAFQACALGRYANPPEENLILGTTYDLPQILRAALPCRTPPGLEGSKGRPALMGARRVLLNCLARKMSPLDERV